MDLYERILYETIARELLPAMRLDARQLVEMKCYQAILKIYEIVSNEQLEDTECFWRVEEIVTTLDELGIGGGGRLFAS